MRVASAPFFLYLYLYFSFFPVPFSMLHAAFSWATVATSRATWQAGNSYHFFALTHGPRVPQRESETETETVTETAIGRQSAQSGSSLLLLAFID